MAALVPEIMDSIVYSLTKMVFVNAYTYYSWEMELNFSLKKSFDGIQDWKGMPETRGIDTWQGNMWFPFALPTDIWPGTGVHKGCEAASAVVMKSTVLWDITPRDPLMEQ
jgi:hypothetical protein